MSTDYVPPEDPEERLIEIALDPWIGYARTILWFCGLVYIVLGLALGPLLGLPMMSEPDTRTMGIVLTVVYSVVCLVLCGGFGLFNLVTASGLGRGKKWAWIAAVAIGGIYAPSACCLFGVVLLYATLNDKTRRLFLG